MSVHRVSIASIVAAAALSVSSLAFARQPAALQAAQARVELAACHGAAVISGPGYRDAGVRLEQGHATSRPHAIMAVERGYRDALVRSGAVSRSTFDAPPRHVDGSASSASVVAGASARCASAAPSGAPAAGGPA
jgi:hypothetical protein